MTFYLVELGHAHPLRNTPLGELKAEVRNYKSDVWRLIAPSWGYAHATFNQLSGDWVQYNIFRVRFDG